MTYDENNTKLKELEVLLEEGIFSPEEFEQEKKKLISSNNSNDPEEVKVSNHRLINDFSPRPHRVEEPRPRTLHKASKSSLLTWILGGCLLAAIFALVVILSLKEKESDMRIVEEIKATTIESNEEHNLQTIKLLITQWCEFHTTGDVSSLADCYGSRVKYYQSDYSREEVLDSKRKAFAKSGSFAQDASDFRFEKKADGSYKIYFTKNTTSGQYPSYVSVRKNTTTSKWQIIEESDFITDKNLAKRKLAKMTLQAEDQYYSYYTEIIKKGVDEFDLDEKKLYQYNKNTYEVKFLLTCGDELATSLTPIKGNGEKIKVYAIDEVRIITPSVIILSGSSDYRNVYSYLLDTGSIRCALIEADLGFGEIRNENGQSVIVAHERHYADDGPEIREKIFDINGQFLHYGKNLGKMFDD